MINKRRVGALVAVSAALLLGTVPAGATDLNCGDPGTWHNMPVDPGDPHGLDRDGNGKGCEDPDVFPPGDDHAPPTDPPATEPPVTLPEPVEPPPTVPPADDDEPHEDEPDDDEAVPAAPVPGVPTYTG